MKFEKDITIIIKQEIFDQLKRCVKNASPNEACGFIFGTIEQINNNGDYHYRYIGKKFECVKGHQSPVSFLIDNVEMLNNIWSEAYQKHKLNLISIFHSHPGGAYPSGVDTRNMKFLDDCGNKAFKNQIWTIMDASNHELNGFIYFNKEFVQTSVEI